MFPFLFSHVQISRYGLCWPSNTSQYLFETELDKEHSTQIGVQEGRSEAQTAPPNCLFPQTKEKSWDFLQKTSKR